MLEDKYPESKKRTILLSDEISQNSVSRIIEEIIEINEDDDLKAKIYKDWERKPIMLFINTYGGSVYDGLALIDMIKESKTPVYTICIGSCMCMGLWIWLSGKKRIVGHSATLMFHDMSTWAIGKTEYIKQELSEMIRLQKALISTIVKSSLVTEVEIQDYITRKAEWYIPAEKAIEYKLADEYFKQY